MILVPTKVLDTELALGAQQELTSLANHVQCIVESFVTLQQLISLEICCEFEGRGTNLKMYCVSIAMVSAHTCFPGRYKNPITVEFPQGDGAPYYRTSFTEMNFIGTV